MYINFIADAQRICKTKLESMGVKLTHDDDPILSWFTYCLKIIPQAPRRILKAKTFSCPPEDEETLKKLEQQIENGADLTPYLSKGIKDCSRDDLMLYDWGIYHLHVSDELVTGKADGFMKRSSLLLYALFNDDTAYFIRTIAHRGEKYMWSRQEYLDIIYENWPKLLENCIINDFSADNLTDKERQVLRRKHGNAFVTLKNGITILPPNLGIMSKGISLIAILQADKLRNDLHNAQSTLLKQLIHDTNSINSINLIGFCDTGLVLEISHKRKVIYDPQLLRFKPIC